MVIVERPADARPMTTNKELVDGFIQDLFTKADLDAVDRYLDPEFVNHDSPFPGAPEGPAGMRFAADTIRRSCPDWRSDLHRLVAEDDIVVEHFTASGTHTGEPFMGVPASGKTISMAGINIFRINRGRIVERWGCLDTAGVLQQLGLLGA